MVDRKFCFYKLENASGLVALFSQDQAITLLDGELVRHVKDRNIVYLLFDVVQINNEYYGDRNLQRRLEAIRSVVIPYREEVANQQTALKFPFVMCGKKFYAQKFNPKSVPAHKRR